MKTALQIETEIQKLQQQLSKAKQAEREARTSKLLRQIDKSGLTEDEISQAIAEAAARKTAAQP